ncbi:MAG: hypothetical protein IH624_04550 [Phycisphaerae bacterium]|nr:hypothetical protein [Phycisphaerae bacterium]
MMRIDVGTNGIDTIAFGNADGEWLRTSRSTRKAAAAENADAALRVDYAAAIRKALQLSDEDTAVIEAARKAIEQDTLESPQNIRAAAENLLTFGI